MVKSGLAVLCKRFSNFKTSLSTNMRLEILSNYIIEYIIRHCLLNLINRKCD